MKNILITGGPTNEYIDEVMKITNIRKPVDKSGHEISGGRIFCDTCAQ